MGDRLQAKDKLDIWRDATVVALTSRQRPPSERSFTVHYPGFSGGDEEIGMTEGRLRPARKVDAEMQLKIEKVFALDTKRRKVLKLLCKRQRDNENKGREEAVFLKQLASDAKNDTSVKRKNSTVKALTRDEIEGALTHFVSIDLVESLGAESYKCLLSDSVMHDLVAGVSLKKQPPAQAQPAADEEEAVEAMEAVVEAAEAVEEAAVAQEEEAEEGAYNWQTEGHEWLQRRVRRRFKGRGTGTQRWVTGTVIQWVPEEGEDEALWRVKHDDGDEVRPAYDGRRYLQRLFGCLSSHPCSCFPLALL